MPAVRGGQRTHPGPRAGAAARRSASGRFAGPHEVHRRCTRGQSSGVATGPARPPNQRSAHRAVAIPHVRAPAGITRRIRFSGEYSAVDRTKAAAAAHRSPESAGTIVAPCLLGCRGTARQRPVPAGSGSRELPHSPADPAPKAPLTRPPGSGSWPAGARERTCGGTGGFGIAGAVPFLPGSG